jgi:hypothetical protein
VPRYQERPHGVHSRRCLRAPAVCASFPITSRRFSTCLLYISLCITPSPTSTPIAPSVPVYTSTAADRVSRSSALKLLLPDRSSVQRYSCLRGDLPSDTGSVRVQVSLTLPTSLCGRCGMVNNYLCFCPLIQILMLAVMFHKRDSPASMKKPESCHAFGVADIICITAKSCESKHGLNLVSIKRRSGVRSVLSPNLTARDCNEPIPSTE